MIAAEVNSDNCDYISTLESGQALRPNDVMPDNQTMLCSKNRNYILELNNRYTEADNGGWRLSWFRLIEEEGMYAEVAHSVCGNPCDGLEMKANGNLTLSGDGNEQPVSSSNTTGHDGARLRLRNNGKLSIEYGAFWSTRDEEPVVDGDVLTVPVDCLADHRLRADIAHDDSVDFVDVNGDALFAGKALCSRNGKYRVVRNYGVIALYEKNEVGDYVARWSEVGDELEESYWNNRVIEILDKHPDVQLVLKNNGVLSIEYGALWEAGLTDN